MTFNDIFNSNFLEQVTTVSMLDMIIAIGLSFAIGLFIMAVYQKTFKGVLYSQSFCVSLMAMSLITTIIILAITSNVVLSLGMVGALSIVRFRSAVKEPLDIAFLFWSISVGIILGAGFITLAVFGSLIIGLILVLFVNKQPKDIPYILVINCRDDISEQASLNITEAKTKKYLIKSKTVSDTGIEITADLRLKDAATDFVNEINRVDGVNSAVLVSYSGEYMN